MGGWGVSRARRVRCGVSAVHPLLQHVADTFQRRYASLSQFHLTQGARRPRLWHEPTESRRASIVPTERRAVAAVSISWSCAPLRCSEPSTSDSLQSPRRGGAAGRSITRHERRGERVRGDSEAGRGHAFGSSRA